VILFIASLRLKSPKTVGGTVKKCDQKKKRGNKTVDIGGRRNGAETSLPELRVEKGREGVEEGG